MRNYFSANRRKLTIGGLVGGGIGVAGAAVAAILLTTTITGQATINEVETSNAIEVTASSANGSRLDCSKISVADDGTRIEFNPVLTKPVGGGNASNVPVPGGDCTVTFRVKNTGDTAIKVDRSSRMSGPSGWTVGAIQGDVLAPIAPGQERAVSVKLIATQAATAGQFSGQLVYSDAS